VYDGLKVAVVVPAHNEERLVGKVLTTMPDLVDHIIVVDDASIDRTAEAVRAVPDPRVELITHDVNQGVGGAILTGHQRVLELGLDVSVVMAGDAQMDPAFLPALLEPIATGEASYTKANRFFSPQSFSGMPRHRIFGNVLLSFLCKAASGYWGLFDPQNGYTAVRRSVLERLPFDRIARRYEFENDMLVQLSILRVPARDVPIPAVYGEEVSGMRLWTVGPRIFGYLWRGFWHRIWWKYVIQSFSPVALMLFAGLGMVFLGLAVGVFVVVNTLGPPVASPGTVILCVGPLLTGVHLLVMAMFLDIQEGTR